ncbi:MAG: pyruvate dehydrogenase complex dihydrolipoamide acetyltransferase [Agrococcus casei]|uniref:pyruvate dehydrogenase complex dihydrolipoamide acetyltransferase n=1 Tax=Agrococcus casei TaxID=343512 RepID=UPI003F92CBCE
MSAVVKMPQLAAGEETATVQAWLVAAGDTVAEGQGIAEIETEKAVVDFEAESEGVFAGHLVEAGETVDVGTPIAVIAAEGEDLEAALAEHGGTAAAEAETEAAEAEPEADAEQEEAEPEESRPVEGARRFASPLARKLAKERGLELDDLVGSGPGGRIVRRDVDAHESAEPKPASTAEAAASVSPAPASAGAAFEDVPHTRMRKAIARRLTESKGTVPHYYLSADVRMDALLELRKQANETSPVKISVNDFVIKAVAASLQDVPEANSIWTDDAVRKFSGVDISVAVSVPGGLVTPVLRSVHSKSLSTISVEMKDYALRAREGSLKQDELVGGSFSVSNLGMYGTREFSAIINPPQSGILAVGAASRRAVVNDEGELEVATVMTVTLSADHRVLDGALAAEWLAAFVIRVESPVGLLV